MKKWFLRIMGILIIVRTLIPPIILCMFLSALYFLGTGTVSIVRESHRQISDNMLALELEVDLLKEHVHEMKAKIDTVRADIDEFSQDVQKAVKPITTSMKAIQTILKTVLGGIAYAVNGLIEGVKKISFGKIKIPKVDLTALENLNLLPISFPDLDIDLSLNTQSLEEIQRICLETVNELEQSIKELRNLYTKWITVILAGISLFILWLSILFLGFLLRMGKALTVGWRLLKGEEVEGAVLYL